MPEKNVALARKVREWTRAHPGLLDMDTWIDPGDEDTIITEENACGTTACFAGWTSVLSGDRVVAGGMLVDSDDRFVVTADSHGYNVPVSVDGRAMELLGLERWEANRLFMCNEEDLDDVLFEIFEQEI